jgi:hypothetical protein
VPGYQAAVTDQPGIALNALAPVCILEHSPAPSSSELMAQHLLAQFHGSGMNGASVRCVDFDVKAGVESDTEQCRPARPGSASTPNCPN